jgi:hypothetical protein
MNPDTVQAILTFFSLMALIFLAFENPWSHWGPRFGLAGQPFWLYATWTAQPFQWGMFTMAIAFTAIYIAAIWAYQTTPKSGNEIMRTLARHRRV